MKKIKIHRITPIKNSTDGEVALKFFLEYEGNQFVTMTKYSLALSLLSKEHIGFTNKITDMDGMISYVNDVLDQYRIKQAIDYMSPKELCPFCGSLLFDDNGHKHCLNINCIDFSQYMQFSYDRIFKILPNITEKEFKIFTDKLTACCVTFNKGEFNLRNIINSMNSDITLGLLNRETKNFYNKFLFSIKNMTIEKFLSLCGVPNSYEDTVSLITFNLNNDFSKLVQIMKTINQINLSFFGDDNNLNEYLRVISLINEDTIGLLSNI